MANISYMVIIAILLIGGFFLFNKEIKKLFSGEDDQNKPNTPTTTVRSNPNDPTIISSNTSLLDGTYTS